MSLFTTFTSTFQPEIPTIWLLGVSASRPICVPLLVNGYFNNVSVIKACKPWRKWIVYVSVADEHDKTIQAFPPKVDNV